MFTLPRRFGAVRTACILSISLLALALAGHAQTGPTSDYYVTQYTGGGAGATLFLLRGTAVVTSAPNLNFAAPIAISGTTVRTAGFTSGQAGNVYNFDGTATGQTDLLPNIVQNAYDSTSDGQFNYLVDFSQGAVFRTDLDYSNPIQLFGGVGPGNFLGITYDGSNNSLWISGWGLSEVRDVTMSGTVLSSFTPRDAAGTALNTLGGFALNPTTGTLWMTTAAQDGQFREYNRAGVLQQTVSFANLAGVFILGGEFVSVPEPSTYALLAVGLAAVIWLRRRRA